MCVNGEGVWVVHVCVGGWCEVMVGVGGVKVCVWYFCSSVIIASYTVRTGIDSSIV